MNNPSSLFTSGFRLETETVIPDKFGVCGLCAQSSEVLHSNRVIKAKTSDIADLFRYSAYCCIHCAVCMGQSKLLVGNLYADNTGYACKPMIAQASATPERPSWRDLVRSLSPGTQTVMVVTSNTKRRLWPMAVTSIVGESWRILFVDANEERIITVRYNILMSLLDTIEQLMAKGYSKNAIATHLPSGNPKAFFETPQDVMAMEAAVSPHRNTDEFMLALFIAQKDA